MNNAVFAGIMNIYGTRFFIYGPLVLFMPEAKTTAYRAIMKNYDLLNELD